MADTTSPLPSQNEPVIDRYRRWSPIWYPWIKRVLDSLRQASRDIETVQQEITTLETTVSGNTASITQVLESVDGIEASWGIVINQNNRVTGVVRLDGGITGTTFGVLADKFVIVHPGSDGTTIQAFITGLVEGVSTVGINGNLIVDGTILARHLEVSTLSAIAANIGDVTAGVLRSSDNKFRIDLSAKTMTIET